MICGHFEMLAWMTCRLLLSCLVLQRPLCRLDRSVAGQNFRVGEMAGHNNRDTMENLEDGEISGSDSEPEMHSEDRQQRSSAVAFSAQHFQSGDRPQTASYVTSYRSSIATDSSDSDSEEEAALWRRKRQKCSNVPVPPTAFGRSGTVMGPPCRKVNNIWGSVVQEQSQEAVAAELGIMGMEGGITMDSRQSETYNYLLARKLMEKEKEEHDMETMLEGQLEEYMQHRAQEEKNDGHLKRKRSAKERLGPKAEMDFKGRYELTMDDPEDKVIDEIAHRLMEPKKELIERVVKVIGTKKAIELLSETATIEQSGGLYTVDGSRRRTPGGVYLNLLKHTPSISHDQVKEIFYEENQKEYNSKKANKKAAKQRQKYLVAKKMKQAIGTLNLQEHDDVSRETFASDTNDALESLEDGGEDQPESALGTEEAPVVYNSNDLEVF
ncbi:phosphorylated adapter RNA export protein isoform X2 [Neoarius graeffei]|uniref:phosphorylated adapter RNA export protein isoform X2 n=1 Tax=Neoarius graeffei TaxID=443677 RepID=UPI00298C1555|nr:phosphorylated adapter RNA export protein isoform X2 [Neoarius graeffei]